MSNWYSTTQSIYSRNDKGIYREKHTGVIYLMKYRIRNIYNSNVVELNAVYVSIHSGILVGWIITDIISSEIVTTLTLSDEHYKVSLDGDTIYIKRR